MNGRIQKGQTPEERLAAVARSLIDKMAPAALVPDYADLREEIAPYVRREILAAVLQEIQNYGTFNRAMEIIKQIEECDRIIASRKT